MDSTWPWAATLTAPARAARKVLVVKEGILKVVDKKICFCFVGNESDLMKIVPTGGFSISSLERMNKTTSVKEA